MRLVCISDTHMAHRSLILPEGDVLIHAGDATGTGTTDEVSRFLAWFSSQSHRYKVLIAGNHDWLFQRRPELATALLAEHPSITYLQDAGVEIEGVKFWGSPWQPWFLDWAFNAPRKGDKLRRMWNRIPIDTEVLITHGPPHGTLDQVFGGPHLGCEELTIRLASVRPRVHVFGHIHANYGVAQSKSTTYVNASSCTEEYQALNQPIVVDLTPDAVSLVRAEDNSKKERLEALKKALEDSTDEAVEVTRLWLRADLLEALMGMASLRGTNLETLLQDYVRHGFHSDLAKQLRAEAKSVRKPTPLKRVDDAN